MNKTHSYLLLALLTLVGLYLTSLYNYLLFHNIAELFSIVIASGIFMIAWNSRQFIRNNYLLFIGVAYLFVGGLDLVHTLAYKGMAIFKGYETNLATQLWVAARSVESLSLLIAPLLLRRRLRMRLILFGYSAVFALLLLSIFYWDIFPVCFVEGAGLTPFKKISEYAISLILFASVALLYKNREEFEPTVLRWVIWSVVLTIVSELCFTFYIDAYGLSNLIGHYFKILSFYFIYKAVIETGLAKPYDLLFRDIKRSEERYHSLFTHMINGFAHHKLLCDENGKPVDYVFLEVNDAFEKIIGLKREQLIGKKVTEVFPGIENDSANWIGTYGEVAMSGKAIHLHTYSEALRRWYSIFAYSSEKNCFETVFEDVTERKQAEQALRKAHDELEKRVRERTSELSAAVQRLQAEIVQRKRLEDTLRESEHKVRFFASQCLTAQETERKRIAGELHDSIAASLAAIRLRIERIAKEMTQGIRGSESLEDIASTVAEINTDVRRIMADLRPSILDDLGILAALNWFCREYQKAYSHISVAKQIGIEEQEVPDSLKTPIFRISQEAMNNISGHSHATLIKLSIQKEDGRILLSIQDNGQGFDPETVRRGLGLSSIRERAELSGGTCSIESVIGEGTAVRCLWPI